MAGIAFLNGFANMGESFMRAFRSETDRIRQEERDKRETAWVDENRGRQRKAWAQEDQEQQILADAFSPAPDDAVSASGQKAQGVPTTSATMAAGGIPTEATSPYKQQLKAADALMAVNPRRAIEMRNAAMQSRAAEITLSKTEREEVDNHYNNVLMTALDSSPVWYEGAAKFAQDVGKTNVVPEVSKDGKKVSMYAVGQDGERKLQGTFSATEAGKLEFLEKASKQDPKAKMALLHANMVYERDRSDKAEDREATLAGQERIAKFQHGLALSRDAASEARAAGRRSADAKDASAKAAAGVALYKENNPGATPAQLEAVRQGILSAAPKEMDGNSPSEVKLASAMVKSGLAPDMRSGLEMAITKRSQSAKETYIELMKPQSGMSPREEDVAATMVTAYGPDWKSKVYSSAPKQIQNATDADIKATAKKHGVTEAEVRKRLGL